MAKLFLVLIIIVGIIAIAQLMRVYELSAELRNKREEDISAGDNKLNANLMIFFMLFFFGSVIWLMSKYGSGGLGVSASKHGEATDWLLGLNLALIIVVFFATNSLLFIFAYKYYYRKDRKAFYYPHNNKLELLWTVVPASVLAVIIILGLKTWNEITAPSGQDSVTIEVYAKQFDWTARYAGENNLLGHSDFRLVNAENPLGVLTKESLEKRIAEIKEEWAGLENKVMRADSALSPADVLSVEDYTLAKEKIDRLKRHLVKVEGLKGVQNSDLDIKAYDDKVTKELHLIKGKEYEFVFRSQDVIHSAYFPHFRTQMNCVPGMTTRFKFIPTVTTDSMRIAKNDPSFDYVLLCNKICGAAHSNMQMKVVVESEQDFKKWISEQKTLKQVFVHETTEEVPAEGPQSAESDTPEVSGPVALVEIK